MKNNNKPRFIDGKRFYLFLIILFTLCVIGRTQTPQTVYNECVRLDIKFPIIVTAQSIQECYWSYKSHNAKVRHNLFGLRNDNWATTHNPKGYKVFDAWEESVQYYRDHIQNRYHGGSYYDFLTRIGYATDPNYIWAIKSHVKRLKKELKL